MPRRPPTTDRVHAIRGRVSPSRLCPGPGDRSAAPSAGEASVLSLSRPYPPRRPCTRSGSTASTTRATRSTSRPSRPRLAAAGTTARASFARVSPKSIWIEHPPLLVRLPSVTATVGDASYLMTAVARVYEIGAISLCFVLEDALAPAVRAPPGRALVRGPAGARPGLPRLPRRPPRRSSAPSSAPARSTRSSTRTTRSTSSTATTRPSTRSRSSRARRSRSRRRPARRCSATPSRTRPTTGPCSPGTRPSSSRPSRRRTWSR